MVWFRENWYEEVLRQLKQGLAKCHAVAFENRGAGSSLSLSLSHSLIALSLILSLPLFSVPSRSDLSNPFPLINLSGFCSIVLNSI